MSISFIDLQSQKKRLNGRIESAIHRVLEHGIYIMGPEVALLEKQLSEYCGAKHSIGCANGTDALLLVLMAKGIRAGDAVLVPAFTFAATAEVVAFLGATPVFVDVLPDTFNMDPNSLERGVAVAKELGLKPRAVISVDLYGQPADYDAIEKVCHKHDLWLLSDAAQSFGASYKGRKVGAFGLATATSFYPAKPLGCYGDGGAIFTNDDELAEILRSIRVHGQGKHKYDNVRIGVNGRLDTIQAAILIEKLSIFDEELQTRHKIAENYSKQLQDFVRVPKLAVGNTSAWAQYTICLNLNDVNTVIDNVNSVTTINSINRDQLIKDLESQGIPTVIHYPKPLHKQEAFKAYPTAGHLAVSERLAETVLSLPMHPYLDSVLQERIIKGVKEAWSHQKSLKNPQNQDNQRDQQNQKNPENQVQERV